MNELLVNEKIKIEDLIYEVRGKQVMFDSDLAKLYQCKNGTKTINLAVKRHINRFPERFIFQLTREEYYNILRFQSETLELEQGQYSKYLPYVFTEQGVAMLATILRTSVAESVSIQIMDAFVYMRKFIGTNNYNQRISNIETKLIDYDNKFDLIFDKLENTVNNHVFFEGQIYDAYSLLVDILNQATDKIIIIDNYIDKKLLDICSNVNLKITIITGKINKLDLEKYNKQYSNIEILISNSFHDRFVIIDNKILYHCGASFKDLGKKCFAINKIESQDILNDLLNKINL